MLPQSINFHLRLIQPNTDIEAFIRRVIGLGIEKVCSRGLINIKTLNVVCPNILDVKIDSIILI